MKRYIGLAFLAVMFLCCGGGADAPVSDSDAPAFLEGLPATEEAPLWVKCSGGGISFEMSFVSTESFASEYQGMRSAFETSSDHTLDNGMVFNGDLAESCEVLHREDVLETWSR